MSFLDVSVDLRLISLVGINELKIKKRISLENFLEENPRSYIYENKIFPNVT
jgi:hypothetical protein